MSQSGSVSSRCSSSARVMVAWVARPKGQDCAAPSTPVPWWRKRRRWMFPVCFFPLSAHICFSF